MLVDVWTYAIAFIDVCGDRRMRCSTGSRGLLARGFVTHLTHHRGVSAFLPVKEIQ